MKTSFEIKKARHQIALYERHRSQSENQRAFLFGSRCCLGLMRYKLPITGDEWEKMLFELCRTFDQKRQAPHYPALAVSIHAHTGFELTILRNMAARVLERFEIPPLHKAVLVGVRSALAWVLELPAGGKNVEIVLANLPLESALPVAMPAILGLDN